nr:hypothetical protein Itr_chr12CG07000 [Ipomoea trifida]GMD62901.1 hypothetical protein Iba_chr12bCG9830 [Ipomoea batatas]GMD67793.1 hypothetical protein Iba_chr12dCG2950 [Ipomoea batatas]
MISADVIGLLPRACIAVADLGDPPEAAGEVLEAATTMGPPELALRDDDFFSIFNPNNLFTLLVTAIPTPAPGLFMGDPGAAPPPSSASGWL